MYVPKKKAQCINLYVWTVRWKVESLCYSFSTGNAELLLCCVLVQIQVIKIETEDNRETRSAKDALLLWCQMKTAG